MHLPTLIMFLYLWRHFNRVHIRLKNAWITVFNPSVPLLHFWYKKEVNSSILVLKLRMTYLLKKYATLVPLKDHNRNFGKQWGPRWNATCSISYGSTLFANAKLIFRERNIIYFGSYNLLPLNGPCWLNRIKLYGKFYWYTNVFSVHSTHKYECLYLNKQYVHTQYAYLSPALGTKY